MANYMEWLKQLFGETEGKEGRGILPISMVHTRDLHSLGQFVQEGNKILFEIAGVSEDVAREALRLAMHKLPIKCKFVKKDGEKREN